MKTKIFSFKIDAASAVPVYEQVIGALKRLILAGQLEKNEKLFPVKELATILKVNPNTIAKVYYRLETEGFVYSLPGKGYFIKSSPGKFRKERQKLFHKAADVYISISGQLGFDREEMIDNVTERVEKMTIQPVLRTEEKEEENNDKN